MEQRQAESWLGSRRLSVFAVVLGPRVEAQGFRGSWLLRSSGQLLPGSFLPL